MDFIIKEYKRIEFVNLLTAFSTEGGFNMGLVEFDPNNQNDNETKAIIQDDVATKLTEVQLLALRSI